MKVWTVVYAGLGPTFQEIAVIEGQGWVRDSFHFAVVAGADEKAAVEQARSLSWAKKVAWDAARAAANEN